MKIPCVIDGPEMFLRDEFLERLPRWDRRPRARFRVVAVRAARFRICEPVDGRDILVGARHFYAGIPRQLCRRLARGGDRGVWPLGLSQNVQIHLLDFGWRWSIAAVEPNENTCVTAEAASLIGHGRLCNGVRFRSPALPSLPCVTASPPGHDENAELVRLFEEFVAVDAAFEANRVHAHVAHIG